jgi:hypothetical protein
MSAKKLWRNHLADCFGKTVRLPSRIDVEDTDGNLCVSLPRGAPIANMQTDEAAFEAWCLALKSAGAKKITLSWRGGLYDDAEGKLSLGMIGHANRFRHRVNRFSRLFPAWFDVDPKLASSVSEMIPAAPGPDGTARWVLNVEQKQRNDAGTSGPFHLSASEHDLELAISRSSLFRERFSLEHVSRQLPVGMFDGLVAKRTAIFTGQKSAIDLWGIVRGSRRLALFELKNAANKKAGALSELFFYATLLREVQRGTVRFDRAPVLSEPSYQDIAKTTGIDAYVLAPKTHPLLLGNGQSVIDMLNVAFEQAGEPIKFGLAEVQADQDFKKL